MATYTLQSTLRFGKFKGNTIAQIIEQKPNYLVWCLENLEVFNIDDDAAAALTARFPSEADRIEHLRHSKVSGPHPRYTRHTSGWTDREIERATFDALTDGQMGSYDEYEGDWERD